MDVNPNLRKRIVEEMIGISNDLPSQPHRPLVNADLLDGKYGVFAYPPSC